MSGEVYPGGQSGHNGMNLRQGPSMQTQSGNHTQHQIKASNGSGAPHGLEGRARFLVLLIPPRLRVGWILVLWGAGLCMALLAPGLLREAEALELCGAQAKTLMKSVGIRQEQMEELCRKAAQAEARLSLSVTGARNELGYCRLTLALANHSTEYLNAMVLSSQHPRFDTFRFHNIQPGGTGYASANSNILLDCEELKELKLALLWPISLRMGDRSVNGRSLARYRPLLHHPILTWKK